MWLMGRLALGPPKSWTMPYRCAKEEASVPEARTLGPGNACLITSASAVPERAIDLFETLAATALRIRFAPSMASHLRGEATAPAAGVTSD
jgi:hypothetical protein